MVNQLFRIESTKIMSRLDVMLPSITKISSPQYSPVGVVSEVGKDLIRVVAMLINVWGISYQGLWEYCTRVVVI